MRNISQSQNRLKWQVTKYDSLKFSLKVCVKNSECTYLNQDPEISLLPGLKGIDTCNKDILTLSRGRNTVLLCHFFFTNVCRALSSMHRN